MGMSRSKLKRDREKNTTTDKRMTQTIKHLKHSISVKERRIKELEKYLNEYNLLHKQIYDKEIELKYLYKKSNEVLKNNV